MSTPAEMLAAYKAEYTSHWSPKEADQDPDGIVEHQLAPKKQRTSANNLGSFTAFMGNLMVTQKLEVATPSKDRDTRSEVEIYFDLTIADMEEEPLEWWPRHEKLLPNLSRMARQYLGVPATSASCERVFSQTGRVFGYENQHMKGENLAERMWAKINKP